MSEQVSRKLQDEVALLRVKWKQMATAHEQLKTRAYAKEQKLKKELEKSKSEALAREQDLQGTLDKQLAITNTLRERIFQLQRDKQHMANKISKFTASKTSHSLIRAADELDLQTPIGLANANIQSHRGEKRKVASIEGPEEPTPQKMRPSAAKAPSQEISQPDRARRAMRCAFMTSSSGETTAPIGDPFQIIDGWDVSLRVDVGRDGPPYLRLDFRVFKDKGKKSTQARQKDPRIAFSATWHLEPIVGGRLMMEDLESGAVEHGSWSYQPEVVSLCPQDKQAKLQRLVALRFSSNAIEYSGDVSPHQETWEDLPSVVQHGLRSLFSGKSPNEVTIWVCVYPDPEVADKEWISALKRAVNES